MKSCAYCQSPTEHKLCSQCRADSTTYFTDTQRQWIHTKFSALLESLLNEQDFKPSLNVALSSIIFKTQQGKSLSDSERALATDFVNTLLVAHDRLHHNLDITGEEVYRKLTGIDRHTQKGPPFFDLYAGII